MVPKNQEPLVPKNAITISSPEHPRYGQSGVICASAPNNSQQIVTFGDGERLLVNNADINDAIVSQSNQRTYPKEYTEAMSTTGYAYAALKEQHKLELERLSQDEPKNTSIYNKYELRFPGS